MPRGGRRPGSGGKPGQAPGPGRPSRHVLYPGPVRAAENRLRDHLPEVIDELLVMAFSKPVIIKGEDGDVEVVYETPPATKLKALTEIMNRVMGRVALPIDIYDTARRLATERGLDPDRVIDLYAAIKRRGVAS